MGTCCWSVRLFPQVEDRDSILSPFNVSYRVFSSDSSSAKPGLVLELIPNCFKLETCLGFHSQRAILALHH